MKKEQKQKLLYELYSAFTTPSQYTKQRCPRCRRKGHSILECPNMKLLDEKCVMLVRALTPEQSEELQEIIDKKFSGPLSDEQIPSALDFILQVLEHIITKDEDYHE
ncbi:hypothetical protein C2G38_2232722 [Gigaspora rosea]|uniref:CCHC-type domain-containing protein n=1 Tax=Gigaspora rosea TaxID=44941 RepID=A0A397TST7_9GLOM|nr:hypothetical protein C2G38_2232722 [Gigaspora rosea]